MIVTIHQPSYLPWCPFLEKALKSDIFVFLDDVQFEKNSEQNRNRIKTPQGPLWLTIPVERKLHTLIPDVKIIEDNGKWRKKHRMSIEQNYRKAAWYEKVAPKLFDLLERSWERLLDISLAVDMLFFEYLGYTGRIIRSSELNISAAKSDRILEICRELEATVYLSGPAGIDYLDITWFRKSGIDVRFQSYAHNCYPQLFSETGFVPRLSALDLFFNVGIGHEAKEFVLNCGHWLKPEEI